MRREGDGRDSVNKLFNDTFAFRIIIIILGAPCLSTILRGTMRLSRIKGMSDSGSITCTASFSRSSRLAGTKVMWILSSMLGHRLLSTAILISLLLSAIKIFISIFFSSL